MTAIRWPFRLAADSLGRELKKLLSAPHLAQGQRARESAVPRDILRSTIAELVITACRKDWHSAAIGAVLSSDLGAQGRSEILPRRLIADAGLRWCGATPS